MIIEVTGNLLKSDCEVIVHQANCQNTMGSGIALTIKTNHPKVYEADKNFLNGISGSPRLGRISTAWDSGKYFVNLYGQNKYGRDKQYTDYEAVQKGFASLWFHLEKWNTFPKIGIPYKMGCVRGGGDWEIYSKIINDIFIDKNIYAYKMMDYK